MASIFLSPAVIVMLPAGASVSIYSPPISFFEVHVRTVPFFNDERVTLFLSRTEFRLHFGLALTDTFFVTSFALVVSFVFASPGPGSAAASSETAVCSSSRRSAYAVTGAARHISAAESRRIVMNRLILKFFPPALHLFLYISQR